MNESEWYPKDACLVNHVITRLTAHHPCLVLISVSVRLHSLVMFGSSLTDRTKGTTGVRTPVNSQWPVNRELVVMRCWSTASTFVKSLTNRALGSGDTDWSIVILVWFIRFVKEFFDFIKHWFRWFGWFFLVQCLVDIIIITNQIESSSTSSFVNKSWSRWRGCWVRRNFRVFLNLSRFSELV